MPLYPHKRSLLFSLLLALSLSNLKAQSISRTLGEADSLIHQGQEAPALKLYYQVLQEDSTQKTALAQASILTSRKGERSPAATNAAPFYQEAKTLAEAALKKDPNYAPAAYAMALSLYSLSLHQGVKEKIRGLQEVKDYLDRTLLLDSTYAQAWYLLGRWNMAFDKMNFAERAAVKLLFGGMPKTGVAIALSDFIRCKKLKPGFIRNYYYLAQAQHSLGKDLQAIATLREAIRLRPVLQDDRDIQKDCREMIGKLQ